MNITQRKILHGHSRAFMSDHRRAQADDVDAAALCFLGIAALVVLGAILKICGVL